MTKLESSNQCEDATITGNTDKGKQPLRDDTRVFLGETSGPEYYTEKDDGVQLYLAALKGDWEKAETIISKENQIVRTSITCRSEIALHIAVAAKHKEFVKKLLEKMEPEDLVRKNNDENTALCFAAASGVVEIAKMLIAMNETIPNIAGSNKMTPIHMAAMFGHGEMVRYLKRVTTLEEFNDGDLRNLFLEIVSAEIYDVALWMLAKMGQYEKVLTHSPEAERPTALELMARKPSATSNKSQLNLFQNLANSTGFFPEAKKRTLAHQLVIKLCESLKKLHRGNDLEMLKASSKLIFDAAESGNHEFVVILIRSNPDIIWIADDKNRSVFHVAASNRHSRMFNIIYELGGIKNFIALYKEVETKNNMLHLVAKLPPPSRLQVVSGAALQFQRELIWFEAIKEIVPRSYIKDKNTDGQTPHDLFTKEHKNLREEGEKWMKDTATACMLVATLIATVVFAAAFTLPGGYDESTDQPNKTGQHNLPGHELLAGFPRFRNKFLFDLFILADSVSLLSSVTAIGIFLSILTSRYAEADFRSALPTKLMLGLLALFVSIISMVLAFTLAMILIRNREPVWSLIFIICLATPTAFSFIYINFHLWCETLYSAYLSKYLLCQRKSGIFL